MKREREEKHVIKQAEYLLDMPNVDPDDDVRLLARQLLRRQELIEKMEIVLLPMAKGYVAEHDNGRNREMVRKIEETLSCYL